MSAQIVQLYPHQVNSDSDGKYHQLPAPPAEHHWIMPGKLVTVVEDHIYIGIEYEHQLNDDTTRTLIKPWINGRRRKDRYLDENDQLDLRLICRRIITLHHHHYYGEQPFESLISVAEAPYSWEK